MPGEDLIVRAAVLRQYGPPEILQVTDVPTPTPKAGEVLIRVHATTASAADYRLRGANFPPMMGLAGRLAFGVRRPRKQILGGAFAGVVEAAGARVTRLHPGNVVFGSTGAHLGAYAEYVCLPEDAPVVEMPANMTFEEAAAIPFGAMTALHFLRDKGRLRGGQRALIYGASGAVGTAAVQIARHLGAHVTGVCSTANLELVRSLGADRVIDYTREDFTQGSERYDLIFETVGKSSVPRAKHLLTEGGVYIVNVITPGAVPQLLISPLRRGRKVVGGIAPESLDNLRDVKEMVESGALKAVIDRVYPLEQIVDAHRYADTGRKKGNVVITMGVHGPATERSDIA